MKPPFRKKRGKLKSKFMNAQKAMWEVSQYKYIVRYSDPIW